MKFRKKPVVIEAFQLTQDYIDRLAKDLEWKITPFVGCNVGKIVYYSDHAEVETLEGSMRADINDWIITGIEKEQYPCKPGIFAKTYEPLE